MSIITVNADKTNQRPSASDIIGISTTDDLTEGSVNLYYTDARVQDYLDAGITIGDELTVERLNITVGSATQSQFATSNPSYHSILHWRTANNYRWASYLLSGSVDDGTHNTDVVWYGNNDINLIARNQSNAAADLHVFANSLTLDTDNGLAITAQTDLTLDGISSVAINSDDTVTIGGVNTVELSTAFFDVQATETFIAGATTIDTADPLRLASGGGNRARLFTDSNVNFFSTLNHNTKNNYKIMRFAARDTGGGDDGTHDGNIRLYGDTTVTITTRNQTENIRDLEFFTRNILFNGSDFQFTGSGGLVFDQDLTCEIRSYNEDILLEAQNGKVYVNNNTPFKFANMTTSIRNGLSAESGMVIFNTTDAKLQVYDGTSWVDLH